MKKTILFAALLAAAIIPLHAQLRITEVVPWASGNSTLGADWFELTNFGSGTLNISGFKVDDNSNSFGSAATLNGITSIAPGESVIFIESATSLATAFNTLWFGATPPPGLQIGNYSGAGLGLGASGDAVNIYDSLGALQANVTFGASDAVSPFQTFDNAAGVNNGAISLFSVSGTNGAFVAASTTTEVGSPGTVPEPSTYVMVGAVAAFGALRLLRRRNA